MEGSQANNQGNKAGKGKGTTEMTFRTNNLMGIMECARPPPATIQQDAVDAVDRCVTEFAAMVTIAATEQRKKDRREVMSCDDLIKALKNLGFDHYVTPLTEDLQRYRESKGTMRHCGQKRAMAAVAPDTGEMAPQVSNYTLGMPPYVFQVPETDVGTREMPLTPSYMSDFTFGPMMYDFMVRETAPAAAMAASMKEIGPELSETSFVQPPYDFMVQGQAQEAVVALVTAEKPPTPPHPSDFTLGLPGHRHVRADAAAESTSRMLPARR